jgi:catechol 2,3-dioxygenase-like lactoylglutathione lyase family enzyme
MLSKNVEKTSQFFSEILGLKLIHQTKTLAELKDQKDFRLIIKHAPK